MLLGPKLRRVDMERATGTRRTDSYFDIFLLFSVPAEEATKEVKETKETEEVTEATPAVEGEAAQETTEQPATEQKAEEEEEEDKGITLDEYQKIQDEKKKELEALLGSTAQAQPRTLSEDEVSFSHFSFLTVARKRLWPSSPSSRTPRTKSPSRLKTPPLLLRSKTRDPSSSRSTLNSLLSTDPVNAEERDVSTTRKVETVVTTKTNKRRPALPSPPSSPGVVTSTPHSQPWVNQNDTERGWGFLGTRVGEFLSSTGKLASSRSNSSISEAILKCWDHFGVVEDNLIN